MKHIINERDRECLKCHHKWTAPVVMSPHTQALSGEVKLHCPVCADNCVMSGPNKAYVHMERACTAFVRALTCMGMKSAVVYSQWPNAWTDTPQWEIKIGPVLGITFYLHQEEREVKSLGLRSVPTLLWVVNVLVTKYPSHRDDPPYEDNIEVSTAPTAEGALIEGMLSYFRSQMYDAALPEGMETEPEEAWPE